MNEGYEALRYGVAWLDLTERGRIIVRGRDRARLLHAITSNEVKKMAPGDSCYAFLLNPQGRIQADLNLLNVGDYFLIDTEAALREKVLQHIRRYIIADQVELEDVTDQLGSIGVEGPNAESAKLGDSAYTIAPFTITGQPGYRVYFPPDRKDTIVATLEVLGAKPATSGDARMIRIENGKPVYGEDIRDTTLPQETQQMQAVSFNKGCYLGQEIVERIRAQGRVNKQLERVELEGTELPVPGTKIQVDGRDAEITSAVYSERFGKVFALAYVRTK